MHVALDGESMWKIVGVVVHSSDEQVHQERMKTTLWVPKRKFIIEERVWE